MIYYNRTNTCDKIKQAGFSWKRCGNKLIPGNAYKDKKDGKWTGKWICRECYNRDYGPKHYIEVGDPRSSIRDFRIGNLDPKSTAGRGYIGEQITCKTRGIKNQNIEDDNFKSEIDHTIDPEYGIVQTKCFSYQKLDRYWYVRVDNEHNKEFDFLIIHCMSADMQTLERTYIVPYEEVIKRTSIGIAKSSWKTIGWYEQYRIDEKPYNDAYRNLKLEGCPALRNINNVEYVYELFKE